MAGLVQCLPVCQVDRLQSVSNAAARLIYRSRKFDHVTSLLHNLHWLRILVRITFWMVVLAYRCQNGLAPQYLADNLHQVAEVSHGNDFVWRHWSSQPQCGLLSTIALSVAAAWAWNSLPLLVTSSASLPVIRKLLKTVLFTRSFPSQQHFSTFYIVTWFHYAVFSCFLLCVLVYSVFMYCDLAVFWLHATLISFVFYITLQLVNYNFSCVGLSPSFLHV